MTERRAVAILLVGAALAAAPPVAAEPWIAAHEGHACRQCHVNPTGGGLRNVFGHAYARGVLASSTLDQGTASKWVGALDNWLDLGGDLRAEYAYTDLPGDAADQNAFAAREMRLYASARLVPDRLVVYADQRIGPGGSLNREAWMRLTSSDGRWGAKAGRLYLPYGLRLEDDGAFIRQATGLNMDNPDDGVEFGYEDGPWTAQVAVANGGGGAESDTGKLYVLRAAHVADAWRFGASAAHNDAAAGQRTQFGAFATLRTGPIAWLAEADAIHDDTPGPAGRDAIAALIEGNWRFSKGNNFKLTAEHLDPDRDVDEDAQARYSAILEHHPIPYLQVRAGARVYDGIPQNALLNRRRYFLELHAFF